MGWWATAAAAGVRGGRSARRKSRLRQRPGGCPTSAPSGPTVSVQHAASALGAPEAVARAPPPPLARALAPSVAACPPLPPTLAPRRGTRSRGPAATARAAARAAGAEGEGEGRGGRGGG